MCVYLSAMLPVFHRGYAIANVAHVCSGGGRGGGLVVGR